MWVAFLQTSSVLGNEALPGYPFDASSARDKYSCLTGEQIALTGELAASGVVLYDLCVAKEFSTQAQNIIRQAFKNTVHQSLSPAVHACQQKSGLKGLTGSTSEKHLAFLQKLVVPPLEIRPRLGRAHFAADIFISALKPQSGKMQLYSVGYQNYFDNPRYAATGTKWKRHLSLALNHAIVGSTDTPLGENVDFWAAQLASAWMQNMGIDPQLNDLDNSALSAWMQCVLWQGEIPKQYQLERGQS